MESLPANLVLEVDAGRINQMSHEELEAYKERVDGLNEEQQQIIAADGKRMTAIRTAERRHELGEVGEVTEGPETVKVGICKGIYTRPLLGADGNPSGAFYGMSNAEWQAMATAYGKETVVCNELLPTVCALDGAVLPDTFHTTGESARLRGYDRELNPYCTRKENSSWLK